MKVLNYHHVACCAVPCCVLRRTSPAPVHEAGPAKSTGSPFPAHLTAGEGCSAIPLELLPTKQSMMWGQQEVSQALGEREALDILGHGHAQIILTTSLTAIPSAQPGTASQPPVQPRSSQAGQQLSSHTCLYATAIPAPRSSHAHTENPVAGQLCIFSSSSSLRSLDLGDALPHDAGSGCSGTLFPQQGRSPDYVVNNVRGPVLRRASRSAMLDHSPTAADASLPRRGVSRKCSFMLPNPTPRQSGGCSGRVSDSALTTEIAATALADSAAMCDSGGSSFRRKSVEQSASTFPLRSARNRCSTEIDLVIARSGNSSCSGSLPPITNMPASSSPLLHRLACLHSTSFTAGKTASLSGAAAPSHDDRQQQQQHLSHLCPTAAPECHSGSGLARRAIPLRTRSFSRVPSMLQQDAVCHQTIPSSGSTHTLNMGTALVAWLQKPSLHQCSLGSEEGQEAVLPEEQGVAAGGVRECS
ncbi:hypothetical protein V8C86DRAFT_2537925 [Haematococcus lacustris]